MSSLLDLPPELLEQIISALAEEEPPSATFIHEQPSESLLHRGYHSLKDLSCVSKKLRQLCFRSLFSALKVDIEVDTGFLEFINSSQLVGRVNSLVFFTKPECFGGESIWPQMVEIVDCLNAPSVTMIFPPPVFAEVLPYELTLHNAWAFGIDYQVLHLEMPRRRTAPKTPDEVVKDRDVFAMRPWTHCTYNEGSSVKAYSTYEYYLKEKPSPFPYSRWDQFPSTPEKAFEHITSLDLIAVFPTNLNSFSRLMRDIKALRSLRTRLSPTLSNRVLDDPSSLWKCQREDLWMEFEGAYRMIFSFLATASQEDSQLQAMEQFTILDYANANLRKMIDDIEDNMLAEWERDPNGGRWTRTPKVGNAVSS